VLSSATRNESAAEPPPGGPPVVPVPVVPAAAPEAGDGAVMAMLGSGAVALAPTATGAGARTEVTTLLTTAAAKLTADPAPIPAVAAANPRILRITSHPRQPAAARRRFGARPRANISAEKVPDFFTRGCGDAAGCRTPTRVPYCE